MLHSAPKPIPSPAIPTPATLTPPSCKAAQSQNTRTTPANISNPPPPNTPYLKSQIPSPTIPLSQRDNLYQPGASPQENPNNIIPGTVGPPHTPPLRTHAPHALTNAPKETKCDSLGHGPRTIPQQKPQALKGRHNPPTGIAPHQRASHRPSQTQNGLSSPLPQNPKPRTNLPDPPTRRPPRFIKLSLVSSLSRAPPITPTQRSFGANRSALVSRHRRAKSNCTRFSRTAGLKLLSSPIPSSTV
jgi:hypothetical protein